MTEIQTTLWVGGGGGGFLPICPEAESFHQHHHHHLPSCLFVSICSLVKRPFSSQTPSSKTCALPRALSAAVAPQKDIESRCRIPPDPPPPPVTHTGATLATSGGDGGQLLQRAGVFRFAERSSAMLQCLCSRRCCRRRCCSGGTEQAADDCCSLPVANKLQQVCVHACV